MKKAFTLIVVSLALVGLFTLGNMAYQMADNLKTSQLEKINGSAS